MIIKRLYEEFDLSIERILLKEYRRLKLTMAEMSVLIALFSIYKKRKTFTIASISRRVDIGSDAIGNAVESLIEKGYVSTKLESKDGKEREVFDLDQALERIENLLRQDEIERLKERVENDIMNVIRLFEQGLGRGLLPYELENIRRWFEEKDFSSDQIIKAIEDAGDRVSVKLVERMLNQSALKPIEIDSDLEEALDQIYKNIK
ncbi:MAG TPA: winged helix DNA-binding protein [Acholeplasmataceae bacterium]|nr:winged helix DNA-binding protein [Acholeplasmataceae bacterium]HRX45474.1 winged helix DNA-binding protein [Acholeplasmataceae bacterium]